ncbi:secreted RxLR effector protein 161-like [Macadamia integrifolia]|uniref:secreted RxLR effector protein 161-like n=1 Tax=Macadamia integrifolia TaxID=60698 RepID=UPI001C4E449A|nr:secreted RxLR effector protein 161-like [Macadamia integrifolia]
MIAIGFAQSNADHSLFAKREGDLISILIVYVDDTVITRNDTAEISKLKAYLETGTLGCKPSDTPIEANSHLKSKEGKSVDKGRYQRLVGRLVYLSYTRPDIAHVVSPVSQYMHDPYSSHTEVVIHILRYLKTALGNDILFSPLEHIRVEAYTDANWASSPNDHRSTSGYYTFVGGKLVTWHSKKQEDVAKFIAEDEF